MRQPYPQNRAKRIDPSKMTAEELAEHKRVKAAERSARYYTRNPAKCQDRAQSFRLKKPWKVLINAAFHRAKDNGLDYNLDEVWAKATYNGVCALTGISFVLPDGKKGGMQPYSPSLDKIDNTKGYTTDNCRFVLWCVNSFKGAVLTDVEMLAIAKALIAKGIPQ